MLFRSLQLISFKNHSNQRFQFPTRIIGICGRNGSGKTNLLDAIYYLSFTRSYFSRSDSSSIQFGNPGFRIESEWEQGQDIGNIAIVLREAGKKELSVNGTLYGKMSEHIGKFPSIMIAPDDVELIIGGSEERRKFVDTVIAQLQPEYLQQLMVYNKLLQQRNSYLKSLFEARKSDTGLLEVYDQQMSIAADYIYKARKSFFETFNKRVNSLYKNISNNSEHIDFQYVSALEKAPMKQLLQESRYKDLQSQRTNAGPHKDDLIFLMEEQMFKSIASQGQRKSLLFALKLGAYEMLLENNGFPPLLLLDDVFEKLDQSRMFNLLEKVCLEQMGQVFITDTHRERLEQTLKSLGAAYSIIELE